MRDNTSVGLNHDRYLIYKMLGRKISFMFSGKGNSKKVSGITERVCRNIFDNIVEITVGGNTFRFKEPNVIAYAPGSKGIILFMYGKPTNETEMGDAVLFAEVRASLFKGETINDVISRTTPEKTKVQKFIMDHS